MTTLPTNRSADEFSPGADALGDTIDHSVNKTDWADQVDDRPSVTDLLQAIDDEIVTAKTSGRITSVVTNIETQLEAWRSKFTEDSEENRQYLKTQLEISRAALTGPWSKTKVSVTNAGRRLAPVRRQPDGHPSGWSSASDAESPEDESYATAHVGLAGDDSCILLPEDMEDVWPKGYSIFKHVAELYEFRIVKDRTNLARGGFRAKDALSTDETVAREAYAALSKEAQIAVNTIKTLIVFMKLRPRDLLASDNKFALSASYALHFLLKSGDPGHDAKVARCLKHRDGGRSIISDRLQNLFSSDSSAASVILSSADKIYRSIAKKVRLNGLDDHLKRMVTKFCFTSVEGMLNSFYVKERRREVYLEEVATSKGKTKTVKKERLVSGVRVPSLMIGSEFLTLEEKSRLRLYERRFDLPSIIRDEAEKGIIAGDKPEKMLEVAEKLATAAYAVTSGISSAIRLRKVSIRNDAIKANPDKVVTQANWTAAYENRMKSFEPLPEVFFKDIEKFLKSYGRE